MELLLYLYYIFLGAFALALLTPLIVGLIALVGMFVVAIASNRTLELLLNNVLLPVWSYEAVKMAYLSYKSGALGVMSRDVVLAPARNDTVPIQEVSVQTACH